jgi:putative peptidoglycan lipid II flippase
VIQALTGYIGRWNAWTSVSINRRIFAASVIVAAWTLLVHLATALKDVIVAYQFGTTDVLDAFLIAFLMPSFVISIVAGSLPSAFIPIYLEVQRRGGNAAAERFYAGIVGWILIILVLTSLIIALLAPVFLPLLASGFSDEKLQLTNSLFLAALPVVVLKGLTTVWTMKLNVNEQFSMGSIAPIFTPTFTIIALLFYAEYWGIYALAGGVACGAILEAVILGWYLHSVGMTVMPYWSPWSSECSQFLSQYAPMLLGAAVMSSTGFVDQSMAAMLASGSVSSLSYGNKVVSLIIGVGSFALSAAIFPYFSKMVANRDWDQIRHTFRTYAALSLIITLPITATLIYFSEPLVGIIFGRGVFNAMDMHLVAQVQAFYVIQIPFYVLSMLVVRLISSLSGNYLLLRGACLSFSLNVGLNYLFMQWLGVAGIALSTSVTYFVSFLFLYWCLNVQMKTVSHG